MGEQHHTCTRSRQSGKVCMEKRQKSEGSAGAWVNSTTPAHVQDTVGR